jgi:hypothetical protein
MYTKESLMSWGKYKLQKIKDIPSKYFLALYDSKQLDKDVELKEYVEYNLDIFRKEESISPLNNIRPLEIVHFICEKKTFPTKKDAQQSLKKIRSAGGNHEKPMRAYECPKCSGWHLTSMPYETFKEHNPKKKMAI